MDTRLNPEEKGCPVPKMGQPSFSTSVLDVDVSYFSTYWDKEPKTINLLTFLKSGNYKAQVEEVRKIEDKAARDKKKKSLPAIFPSGVFSGRTNDSLVGHSGLVQIDIDLKGNEHLGNFASLKEQLIKIKNVAYCSLSLSGKGYYCFIPIAHPEKHRQHYRALQMIFAKNKLVIDPSCINVARLRGVSYDPEPYFNHQAKAFMVYDEERADIYSKRHTETTQDEKVNQVKALVEAVERNAFDLTSSYDDWFHIGCSLANSIGESGREYFHRLSQFHPKYSFRRADNDYSEWLKRRNKYNYSLGTLYYHCKQAGLIA